MTDEHKENGTVGTSGRNMAPKDDEEPGRLWRSLKALVFGDPEDNSLRAQIEEVIDDHENEAETDRTGSPDLSPLELEMLRNMLHFSENRVDDIAVPRAESFLGNRFRARELACAFIPFSGVAEARRKKYRLFF